MSTVNKAFLSFSPESHNLIFTFKWLVYLDYLQLQKYQKIFKRVLKMHPIQVKFLKVYNLLISFQET